MKLYFQLWVESNTCFDNMCFALGDLSTIDSQYQTTDKIRLFDKTSPKLWRTSYSYILYGVNLFVYVF